jgi:AraC-like DNA-binding protein
LHLLATLLHPSAMQPLQAGGQSSVGASVRSVGDESGEAWREHVRSIFAGTTPERVADHALSGAMHRAELGRISTYGISGGAQVFSRSRRAANGVGGDDIKLSVQLSGTGVFAQDGAVTVVRRGELAIYDMGRPYLLTFDGGWSCAVMTVPRAAVGLQWQSVSGAMNRALPASSGTAQVLARFLTAAVRESATISAPAATRDLGDAALALFTATIADVTSSTFDTPAHALRAQVLDHVRMHLGDPSLTHASVAAHFHLSPRTLDRLFADEPLTLTGHIRFLRLQAARRELVDPALRMHTLAWLATRWGFADAAHFSRSFKAAFEVSPSEARRLVGI